jgi:hypothetical protein
LQLFGDVDRLMSISNRNSNMKKMSLIFLMLIAVSSVVSANGVEGPKPSSGVAVMKVGSTFKVFYKGVKMGNVKIAILNSQGKVVFSEILRKVDNFIRPYNFSLLGEGKYTIEVSDNEGKQIEEVVYKKGNIEKLARLARLDNSNKYVLSYSNKGNNAITVKIYDSAQNLIYTAQEEISGDFAKIYNVNHAQGRLTFEVTDKNGTRTTLNY